jgi:hypothetical protein
MISYDSYEFLKKPIVGDLVFWKQNDPAQEPDELLFIYEVEPEDRNGETYFSCWSLTNNIVVGGVVVNNNNKNCWHLVSRLE